VEEMKGSVNITAIIVSLSGTFNGRRETEKAVKFWNIRDNVTGTIYRLHNLHYYPSGYMNKNWTAMMRRTPRM
jgi:hypothetical protein